MKISGFSIIRNGVKFEYPFLEAYQSLLPLVDELVLNVGDSEDNTLEEIEKFNLKEGQGKIKIIQTHWPMNDHKKTQGGLILSEQTNTALSHCSHDLCIYLQSDELLHEKEYLQLKKWLYCAQENKKVDGLLFHYHHFYGSYDIIQKTRSAYRREVRVIKKSSGAHSVGDAQSFRKKNGEKLNVLLTDCHIYHYGWVRTPDAMKQKTISFDELYHGKESTLKTKDNDLLPHTKENYKYKRFWGLKKFNGTHPKYMFSRIQNKNWNWDFKNSPYIFYLKDIKKVFSDTIERLTGYRPFEYKSYKILK